MTCFNIGRWCPSDHREVERVFHSFTASRDERLWDALLRHNRFHDKRQVRRRAEFDRIHRELHPGTALIERIRAMQRS
ncbi:hypothetical protein TWF481_000262 [Arthrobotrys musiformis]|uniref:Uncharacterized protein n=1 Tax=Arthrobotrys musiformis TaxID=47236 RepID=A0AAV9WMG3_9PEZI